MPACHVFSCVSCHYISPLFFSSVFGFVAVVANRHGCMYMCLSHGDACAAVAVDACKRNIRLNGSAVANKVQAELADARLYMLGHEKEFDAVSYLQCCTPFTVTACLFLVWLRAWPPSGKVESC